jgi:large subunit ribosomal protein L22
MTNSQMNVSATSKYIKISPTKVNKILKIIRGKSYKDSLQILKYLPQKAGAIVWQTLYSAISNASNNFGYEKEKLFVVEAYVNQGPIIKRMQPRAKGRAFKIEKKVSHITIRVSEKINN